MTGEELIREYENGRRDFKGVNLKDADLEGANLEGVDLERANLYQANLQWAKLERVNLQHANLKRANLVIADLYQANLTGANIDFSCWPLWCGSAHIKVDKKIFCQLVAHLWTLYIDDKECKELQKVALKLAEQSHIWKALK